MSNVRYLLGISLVATLAQPTFAADDAINKIPFTAPELKKCEAEHKRLINDEMNKVYEKAFPAYFEYCAGSVWAKRYQKEGGGFGHAFGLIRGACLAKDANGNNLIPQKLIQCPGKTVGFSTNASLISQQWVAHEGRDFVLYGNHPANTPFTHADAVSIRNESLARGTYNNVVLRLDNQLTGNVNDRVVRFLDEDSIGTEFAVAAARLQVICTRVPLTGTNASDKMKPLQTLLNELNALNAAAFSEGYKYNGIVNSCVHTPHTALSAVGAWDRIDNQNNPQGFMELLKNRSDAIAPFNQMLDTYILGKEMKRDQVDNMINEFREGVFGGDEKKKERFKIFIENGWHATQVGTMLDNVPGLTYMNEAFDPVNMSKTKLVTLPELFKDKASEAHPLLKTAINFWNMGKSLVKAWDPLGLTKCLELGDKLNCYLSDAQGPSINLITNLKVWNKDYTDTLNYLRSKPAQEQDEVVRAITAYVEAKQRETQDLLRRASELTVQIPAAPCVDN